MAPEDRYEQRRQQDEAFKEQVEEAKSEPIDLLKERRKNLGTQAADALVTSLEAQTTLPFKRIEQKFRQLMDAGADYSTLAPTLEAELEEAKTITKAVIDSFTQEEQALTAQSMANMQRRYYLIIKALNERDANGNSRHQVLLDAYKWALNEPQADQSIDAMEGPALEALSQYLQNPDSPMASYAWFALEVAAPEKRMKFYQHHLSGRPAAAPQFLMKAAENNAIKPQEAEEVMSAIGQTLNNQQKERIKALNIVNDNEVRRTAHEMVKYNFGRNDAGRLLNLGSIGRLFAKVLSAATVIGNVGASMFDNGSFAPKKLVENMKKNVYIPVAGGAYFMIHAWENERDNPNWGATSEKNDEIDRSKSLKVFWDNHNQMGDFLTSNDYQATAALTEWTLTQFDEHGYPKKTLTPDNFMRYLSGKAKDQATENRNKAVLDRFKNLNMETEKFQDLAKSLKILGIFGAPSEIKDSYAKALKDSKTEVLG